MKWKNKKIEGAQSPILMIHTWQFKIIIFLWSIILGVGCLSLVQVRAAGTVTDTITVKLGYWGMKQEDFVEKATYHWTELNDSLPIHEVAYSFYRDGAVNNTTYGTVIDSARGFYIDDLLDYAGVNVRDVQSIQFYTKDVDIGYFTSFTYRELFSTDRYYFNDLASYFKVKYKQNIDAEEQTPDHTIVIDPNAKEIESVTLDANAWNDKVVVKPMLALEDNWVTYELPMEGTAPDFTTLGTGNRFRLLFGQASPTEQRTNQTAKYVHTLYVMLDGTPRITDEAVELPKEIGSHSITFNVSAVDEAMIQQLIDNLKWSSSDETVLKITDILIQQTDGYADAVQVTINYDILKEGEVSINGNYLGVQVSGKIESTPKEDVEDSANPENSDDTKPDQEDASAQEKNENQENNTSTNRNESKNDGANQNASNKEDSSQNSDVKNQNKADSDQSANGNENIQDKGMSGDYGFAMQDQTAENIDGDKEDSTIENEKSNEAQGGVSAYSLDEQVAQLLMEKEDEKSYEQLLLQQKKEKNIAPYLGIGCVALLGIGSIGSTIEFKKRR